MSSPSFSSRLPWRLFNLFSPERQKAWITRRVDAEKRSITLPPQRDHILRRWIILNEKAVGWPACGNALAHWPGETLLLAPSTLAGVTTPGFSVQHYDPEKLRIGDEELEELIQLARHHRPQLFLLLDENPSLPLLYLAAKSGADYRVGFSGRDEYPFFNLSINSKSPSEWGALLTRWLEPI